MTGGFLSMEVGSGIAQALLVMIGMVGMIDRLCLYVTISY